MSRIAVVTRTKNRPLLLRRCAENLLRQDCRSFLWVVVNDAGAHAPVEDITGWVQSEGVQVQLMHRTESVGVAAAANHGIRGSASEFVHLHDDDDTVAPSFYRRALEFLDGKPHYMGVVTGTQLVEEEVLSDRVLRKSVRKFSEPDPALFISDLFNGNQFAPISFVYRRRVLDSLALFDEGLPVLEDWDFHLRFVMAHDIGGIGEALANYHWRVGSGTSGTPQTVTTGNALHREYTALIRNRLLRQDLAQGRLSVGALAAQGRNQQMSHDLLRLLDDRTASLLKLRSVLKRMLGWARP